MENVTGTPQVAQAPRLCRSALWGAIWAGLGPLAALVAIILLFAQKDRPLPPGAAIPSPSLVGVHVWAFVMLVPLALIVASTPFGTTILGAIGIGQIRRSDGRLYGLRLAAADVLIFPLLVLGSAAFGLMHLVQIAVWTKVHTGYVYEAERLVNIIAPPPASYPAMSFMVLDTIAAIGVCCFAGYAAWRKIAGKSVAEAITSAAANVIQPSGKSSADEPRLSRLAIVGAIWAGVGLLVGALIFVAVSDSPPGKPDGILNLPMPFWAFFPLSGIFASTILGGIAIARIKRSGGKLTGLRLATATALCYPLLLGLQIFTHFWDQGWGSGFGYRPYAELELEKVVAWFFWLGIFYPIVRGIWRSVVGPSDWQTRWFLPCIDAETLTGKATLAVIFAAIGAYALPWYWVSPHEHGSFTVTKIDNIDANESLLLLALAVGASLFAAVPHLPCTTRKLIRGVGTLCVLAALVIQVRFLLSLGEYEPGQIGKVVRAVRSFPMMGLYISIALTALGALFCALRFFEEKSARHDSPTGGKTDDAQIPGEPRFSRLAIVGAVWAGLGVVAMMVCVLSYFFMSAPPTPETDIFTAQARIFIHHLSIPLFVFLAVTAPIGATILGGLAIGHIRRSGGRIVGLPLAFGCGVVFPLLLLAGVLASSAGHALAVTPINARYPETVAALSLIVPVVVCFFIARAAWRALAHRA